MRPFTALLAGCVSAVLVCAAPARAAPDLSPAESRWLSGTWPVVEQARRSGLPVDVVVQPVPADGLAPLALAFVGGRCKLVLSMRDNPAVREQTRRIERDLGPGDAALDAALELMAAHEIFGHCARHVAGQWHAVPDGMADAVPAALDRPLHAAWLAMRATRREEGYADLAALAWARAHRPAEFARLHAWLAAERSHDLVDGSHHDTLAWLRHARAGDADVAGVWRAVLLQEGRDEVATNTRP